MCDRLRLTNDLLPRHSLSHTHTHRRLSLLTETPEVCGRGDHVILHRVCVACVACGVYGVKESSPIHHSSLNPKKKDGVMDTKKTKNNNTNTISHQFITILHITPLRDTVIGQLRKLEYLNLTHREPRTARQNIGDVNMARPE